MAENLVIPELFSQAVSEFPDKVALQIKRDNQWQRLTYKDLEERSLKLATFLIKEGFKKGDTASLILENRPEWAIIYLGIIQAGLACVPLDPQLNQQEIKNLIIDSAAKIAFCSYGIFIKKIKPALKDTSIKIVVLDMPVSEHENVVDISILKDIREDRNLLPQILPQDIASLIYTSGTTAEPKGVLLSHANICSNFQSIAELGICSPADNTISILPLFHTYAFMVTLITPLFLRATVTYALSFKSQEINQILEEANITVLVGVPQLFSMLHKAIFERVKKIPFLFFPLALLFTRIKVRRKWPNLRLLVSGGARLEPKVGRDLSKILGIKLIEGYGLTETSPVVTLNPPQKIKWGSVGKPIPDVQIKIFSPDREGIGQVLITGPNVMQGYFKHPEWTQEVIKERWFYSGDLGYIDSEGYLFLVGREKEVIVLSSGKNIYPEELEGHYSKSPYIKEICILARQEKKFGRPIESLHAIIVPNLEYFQQRNETNIRGKIRWELENLGKNLPPYKHIMGFTITKEELPRTALKKIKRYQVREEYLKERVRYDIKETGFSEEDLKILSKDVAKKIIHYLHNQLKKPVYLDSHLEIDLGIDSLSRVELGLGLQELLSVNIPDNVLYTVSTVKDVIMKISEIIEKAKQPEIYETKVTREDTWSQILREPPKEEILKKIRIEVRLLDLLFTWLFKNLFSFIFRICWLLKTRGKEHLPKKGPFIICPNHASYLDGFIVFCGLPLKLALNSYFLGYSAIFEHPLIRWAIKLARLIPIDPNVHLTDAMQAVSAVISQKKIVCIFPEGHRSIDESTREFKKGVGILIKELDIPVVPVYIKGSHQSWPRTSRLPRFYPLKIIFGRPFLAKKLLEKRKDESTLDDYEIIARRLREEVVKLAC
jgi:long-chain acyl-CoA synthetase